MRSHGFLVHFALSAFLLLLAPAAVLADNAPVADIQVASTTAEGSQPVSLNGSGSTDDVGIVEYRWDFPATLFPFSGTTIDTAEWQTVGSVTQADQLNVAGSYGWGLNGFYSKLTRPERGATLEGRIHTPAGTSYAMVGFHDPAATSTYYSNLVHAMYFVNGLIQIYERGSYRGQFAGYTQGSSYEFKIQSKLPGGASYYYRAAGGSTWTFLYSSTGDTTGILGLGADVYAGAWGFDDLRSAPVRFGSMVQSGMSSGGTVTLTVKDTIGQTDTASVTITSVTGNKPVAAISGQGGAGIGDILNLDGGGSTDDYGVAKYSWVFGDGNSVSGLISPVVAHVYSAVGTYTVTLTVEDWAGQTDTAQHTVVVSAANLVKAVPWKIVGGVEIPHDTWSGREVTLKAVAGYAAVPVSYIWDFGDGSPTWSWTATTVSDAYKLEAKHVYTGSEGTPFNATITITDANGTVASDTYPLVIRQKTLETEMNVAIDKGLWYLHKTQIRGSVGSVRTGYWPQGGYLACGPGSAAQAFGIHGHRIDGDSSQNPYVETVTRAINYLMTRLRYVYIGMQTYGDPDSNGNGIGISLNSSREIYELGQVMDGIIAACPPGSPALAGGANVLGRPYRDLVQDMVDMYAWGQYDHPTVGGGWRYSWNQHPDNSAAQWAAIGCKAAEDVWGIAVPQWVKDRNVVWLNYSDSTYGFGYTGSGGGYATTPSGMVQCAWVGIPRTDLRYVNAENYIANRWSSFLSSHNIYGHYAWAKAMRLQNPPITQLNNGIDWFLDPASGMARYLVNRQSAGGYWSGSWSGSGHLSTSWAVIILTSSLFRLAPVAVVNAQPNPTAASIQISFDASGSYHQDSAQQIVEYLWDFDVSDGIDFATPDAVGAQVTHAYGALGVYTVTLQVKDNSTPAIFDTTTIDVQVTIPPHAPTASAGGPYVAAVGESIVLDGSGSFDIDQPSGDAIKAWDWEVDFQHPLDFNDGVSGKNATFTGGFPSAGTYDIGLRVTDNTATVYPGAGSPDLTDEDFTTVIVYADVVKNLAARPKGSKIQLTWTHLGGGKTWEYEVYRSTKPSLGFQHIASTRSTWSTYLDTGLPLNTQYYYRIIAFEVPASGAPLGAPAGSSIATAATTSRRDRTRNRPPRFLSTPPTAAVVGQAYTYTPTATDADRGDTVSFVLSVGPSGMSADATTGKLTYTPTAPQVGPHTVLLEAHDTNGGVTGQFFQLIVDPAPNLPPVAVTNGPFAVEVGEPILFASAGSQDPDGDPITFAWNFGDGNVSTGAAPSHIYTASGLYVVTLFVSDDRGGTTTASTTVQVDAPNRVPSAVVENGPTFTVRLGSAFGVDGGDSYDLDGDPLTHVWQWGDSTPADTGQTASHIYGALGTYTASLTVDDGRGGVDVAQFTVVVGAANTNPVPNIVVVQTGQHVGDSFVFDGTGSTDPDGDPITYSWTFGDGTGTTGAIVSHSYVDPGVLTVTLIVTDAFGGSDHATTTVSVNGIPVFTSTPAASVAENQPYTYSPAATDPESDPVTITLRSGPAGMTYNGVTGTLSFTPSDSQVGLHTVVLRATDSNAGWSEQTFTVDVLAVNDTPVIGSTLPGVATAVPGILFIHQVVATDADAGDTLAYALVVAPAGMTINATSGEMQWIPALGQVGPNTVTFSVTDATGPAVTQTFVLPVNAATAPVTVPALPGLTEAVARATITSASLAVGLVTTQHSDTVSAGDVISQHPPAGISVGPGSSVSFLVSLGSLGPQVEILGPLTGDGVTYQQIVTGTVQDTNLVFWRLEYARADLVSIASSAIAAPDPDYVVIASGATTLTAAPLGMFDATLLSNDSYVIRLIAQDADGLIQAKAVVVGVLGEAKLGQFGLEYEDLSVPVAGIPIVVTRRYNTLEANREGDFGYGWTLGMMDGNIRETVPGGEAFHTATRVFIDSPVDGKRLGFTFKLVFGGSFLGTAQWFYPTFDPDPGVDATLTVQQTSLMVVSGRVMGWLFGGMFNPREYTLTTSDGRVFEYDQFDGLSKVTEPGGNVLTIATDGVTHSSGASIDFVRDLMGRITQIVDTDGNSIYYAYDINGDLLTVTDQDGGVTAYSYKTSPAHFIDDITDSRGKLAAKYEYDADGRLTAIVDALGNRSEQAFDLSTFSGTFTDALGHVTSHVYDAGGNVLQETDPLGNTTTREYADSFDPSKETAVIDALGRRTEFSYDPKGNVLVKTDPLGGKTVFTWDTEGRKLSETDPAGRTTTFTYDAQGHLLTETNAAGGVTARTYDALGRMKTLTDPNGRTTTYDYGAGGAGSPQKILLPTGEKVKMTHTAAGEVATVVDELGKTSLFTYDDVGRLLSIKNALGDTVAVSWDGELIAGTTNEVGAVTAYTYDDVGNLVTHTDPLGNTVTRTYDAMGRVVMLQDALGQTTQFLYDAMGRLTSRVDPRGSTAAFAYDAVGNLTAVTDRNGRKRTFVHDSLDRLISEKWWNGATQVGQFDYTWDAVGRLSVAAGPGSMYAFGYVANRDLIATVTNAGSTGGVPTVAFSYTYDAVGNALSVTDSSFLVASTFDPLNRLATRNWTGVGMGVVQVDLTRDARGDVTGMKRTRTAGGVVSLLGSTTRVFDAIQRVTQLTHAGPIGTPLASYTYGFDGAGRLVNQAHHAESFAYTYDAVGRLLTTARSIGPNETYTYDVVGNRTSSHLHATYTTVAGNRLSSDGAFAYTYDAEGNLTRKDDLTTANVTTYVWDHRNRLIGVQTVNSSGTVLSAVNYTYDAFDRRISRMAGGTTTFTAYEGDHAWADYNAAGTAVARYLQGEKVDELFARYLPGTGTAWYLQDRLHTVHDLVNDLGGLLNNVNYDSYGNVLAQSNAAAGDRFLFTGRDRDAVTGLGHHRARSYDPGVGRFVSEDPLGVLESGPNPYTYVNNSPVNAADPYGTSLMIEFGLQTFQTVSFLNSFKSGGADPGGLIGLIHGYGITNLIFLAEVLKSGLEDPEGLVQRTLNNVPGWLQGEGDSDYGGFQVGSTLAIQRIRRMLGL